MDEKKLLEQGVDAFGGIATPSCIALLNKPTIVLDFPSLLIDMQMMFSFMLEDEETPPCLCEQCNTDFIVNDNEQCFCSEKFQY